MMIGMEPDQGAEMSSNYQQESRRLSSASGIAYEALTQFLQANPQPAGAKYLEYQELLNKYKQAFTEWINFSEKHSK
ncbi:hypothetical protein [Pseudomonas syringae]|uniref:hypothetical protein n=1 Tax=Pseudomonas syringae TaxID=317 RepID=UPI002934B394|nr:hypothetical protein [Pseudomonas syringae]